MKQEIITYLAGPRNFIRIFRRQRGRTRFVRFPG